MKATGNCGGATAEQTRKKFDVQLLVKWLIGPRARVQVAVYACFPPKVHEGRRLCGPGLAAWPIETASCSVDAWGATQMHQL